MLREAMLQQLRERVRRLPLAVTLWNGEVVASPDARVHIHVHDPKALRTLARPSMGGLARAYVEGWIDLEGESRAILDMGQALCQAEAGQDSKGGTDWRWWHHTRSKDRRNIAYHYDVSNDFYALWLDGQRVYSCAYFDGEDDDLDRAQERKLEHVCRKLMLRPGERLLDIGCGWGGLILHAAATHGVQALGITLSENQRDFVAAEAARRGLADRIQVRLMDYRDVPEEEPFDKIASVGMFEHVGRGNLRAYFDKIARLLRPDGLVMNHGITSVALKARGLGSGISEFIDQYVFPGGELTHVSAVMQELAAAGLECLDVENLRPHYARTLWTWVDRLEARRDRAVEMIGEKRYRIWRIYMAGSAYAFDRNWLALYQILAGRPQPGGDLAYPFRRDHVYAG